MTPALRADLRRVSYGERVVLRDVLLEIGHGEIVGVTGHVGAGKTTLALACAGLLGHSVPAQIEGRVYHTNLRLPVASYVFDDPLAQLTGIGGTVEEEVAVGPENLAIPRDAIRARVDRALAATRRSGAHHAHDSRQRVRDTVARELALFKITADGPARGEVMQVVEIFRGKIIDVTRRSLIVEVTGTWEKIEAFERMVRPFGLVEMARTGEIALSRGRGET